jgi:hypothetical protein
MRIWHFSGEIVKVDGDHCLIGLSEVKVKLKQL